MNTLNTWYNQRDTSTHARMTCRLIRQVLPLTLLLFLACHSLQAQQQVALPAAVQGHTLSAEAGLQIAALMQEKAARTPEQLKLDSQLIYAIKMDRADPILQQLPKLKPAVKFTLAGRVEVDIKATVNPLLLQVIRQLGGAVISAVPRFDAVRAEVPLIQLERLAAVPGIRWIQPAVHPYHNTDSEGDVCHQANLTRQVLGLTGKGVTVGVMSGDVEYLSTLQKKGLLPSVAVLPGQSGLTNQFTDGEGTAMLEIVHDLAPNAALCFADGISDAQMAQNILDLRSQLHCDIIVDDIGFPDESPFQDGIVAQAINAVTQDGVLYFSCARNNGNIDSFNSSTWEGDFVNSGKKFTSGGKTEQIHSFDGKLGNAISSSNMVNLFWSDPWGASSNDYDLFVFDSTGTKVLGASTNPQTGTQDPHEEIDQAFPDGSFIVVALASGSPRFLHVEDGLNNNQFLEFGTNGSTRGHNAAAAAFTLAAVDIAQSYPSPFSAYNTVETFSSDGPRRIFYNPDGSAITPGNFTSTGGQLLAKPDFAAADGVTCDVPGFAPFHGTSSAAPHAAAMAALLKSYQPALTKSILESLWDATAWKIMNNGTDWNQNAGHGLINELAAGVILAANSLNSNLQISSSKLTSGSSATATVTLALPAPPNGLPLAISSDNAAATVPQSVTIPGGATSAKFTIGTSSVATSTTAHITVLSFPQYGGITKATGIVTVTPAAAVTLSNVTLKVSSITGGSAVTGTVTLSGNASANTTITLSSNNAAATVPANVTVTAGSKSATFTATTKAVAANATVTLSAKLGSVTHTVALVIQAPILTELSLNPSTVKGGTKVTGTVTLSGPAAVATTVTLINTAKAATVPANVKVAAGQSKATFTITTTTPGGSGNATGTVKATLESVSQSASLTVTH